MILEIRENCLLTLYTMMTRLPYAFLLKLITALVVMSLLLSSFQKPPSEALIKTKIEQFKQQRLMDSMWHYQQLLLESLAGAEEELQTAGTYFLNLVMPWETVSTEKKRTLLQQNPCSKAWEYAYQIQLHLDEVRHDSAYFYLSLLEATEENQQALIHAYGLFAEDCIKENIKEAFNYLQKAIALVQTTADSILLYPYQANLYTQIGYYEEAIQAAHNHIFHQKQQTYVDSIQLALAYNQLAKIYIKQADYNDAKVYSGEAINYMADRDGYVDVSADMWYNLALSYFNFGNKPLETLLYLRKVFSLLETEAMSAERATAYVDACRLMSQEFFRVKQLDSAQVYVDKVQLLQKKKPTKLSKTWFLQHEIFAAQQQMVKAEQALKKAIDATIAEEGKQSVETATMLFQAGQWWLQQKKYKQAQRVLNEAAKAGSALANAQKLPAIKGLFSKELTVQIISTKVQAMLALYQKSKYNVSLKDIYEHTQYNLNLLRQISHRKRNFVSLSVPVYEQAIEACLLLDAHQPNQEYLIQAFSWAEEFKQVWLQETLKEYDKHTFAGVPDRLVQQEQYCEQQIAKNQQAYLEAKMQGDSIQLSWYKQQIASFQASLQMLKQDLRENYAKYYHFKYDSLGIDLDSLQAAISDSTVLVQYLEGNTSIYQFVITRDSFAVRKIFWRTYKPTILKYYRHFTNEKMIQHAQSGGYKDFCITSYELYYKLLHHELLEGNHRLVIIPDGLMTYVPFGTLLTKLPLDHVHAVNFPSLAYLLKEKQISYNYSSRSWLNDRNYAKHAINYDVLAMGATYEEEEVPDFRTVAQQRIRHHLPAFMRAVSELDSLSSNYAGDFYTNRYATEYYLKDYAARYGIIHLALHGRLDAVNPEYSSLLLAEDGDDDNDNFLMAREIKELSLNTALVVLSHCATGGHHQDPRGAGITAVGSSFMYAGNTALVVSLWQPPKDSSGAIIMSYFYQNLKNKMPKDKALQQAKLKYLQSARGRAGHPTFWAGYVQIGNTSAIEINEPIIYIWWFIIPIAFLGFLGWWSMQALRQRR